MHRRIGAASVAPMRGGIWAKIHRGFHQLKKVRKAMVSAAKSSSPTPSKS
ncbi:hypothetical protein T260_00040 [Geobacillus thermopakistaniensis]|uniref:Uncharacterized protein n=1 Tax=Geobacillus thermopakistaniensis (strain MAS1) TaxID=1408282 RepID=A0A7U9JE41_GEOTM|nr:hypothetical protein T260_00040 [Geobacillus sp. MAS1]